MKKDERLKMFGFVGVKCEEQKMKAKEYLNNHFAFKNGNPVTRGDLIELLAEYSAATNEGTAGEKYAFKDISDYEEITRSETNEAFRAGWDMARTKNKHVGIID